MSISVSINLSIHVCYLEAKPLNTAAHMIANVAGLHESAEVPPDVTFELDAQECRSQSLLICKVIITISYYRDKLIILVMF